MRSALICILALTPLFTHAVNVDFKPSNDFGIKLMRAAISHDGEGVVNRMISPIANHQALGMALSGTAGETEAELLRALGVGVTTEPKLDFGQNARRCADRLINLRSGEDQTVAKLNISNGAWQTNQISARGQPFDFSADFERSMRAFYDAEVGQLNFKTPAAVKSINDWADRKTDHLIPKVVELDEIKDLVFLLMNATYFEGSWANSFYPLELKYARGERNDFRLADGTIQPRDMISSTDYFRHVRNERGEFIELPFVSPAGKEYVFWIALPEVDESPAKYWDASGWTSIRDDLAQARPQRGSITLPKFSFDYTYLMTDSSPLTPALGLDFLFRDDADFRAMATPESLRAKVGLIKGVNRVELDHKGVKAAAVVMVGGVEATSAMPRPPAFDMHVNRPFAFAIAEKTTDALVFIGEVQNPE